MFNIQSTTFPSGGIRILPAIADASTYPFRIGFETTTGVAVIGGNIQRIQFVKNPNQDLTFNTSSQLGMNIDFDAQSINIAWPVGIDGNLFITNGIIHGDGSGLTNLPSSGGDASGPSSATDNAIARFDGTTGKLLQNSGVTIDDAGVINGQVNVTGTFAGTINGGTIDVTSGNFATLTIASAPVATQAYVDSAVTGLLDLKGSTDCSSNPNYPAANKGDAYTVSVTGKIGGASGTAVDAGDVFYAIVDNAGGTEASVGTSWAHIEHNLPTLGTFATQNFTTPPAIGGTTPAAIASTTLTSSGAVTFTANTASTTASTGTLVVTGGIGLSGSINATGNFLSPGAGAKQFGSGQCYMEVSNDTRTKLYANNVLYLDIVGNSSYVDLNGQWRFGGGLTSNAPIRRKVYTVATLPAGTEGDSAAVSDALAPTFLGALTGGGTTHTPVYYNGTAWVAD